ncbi:MAG TPA: NAD-dependent epimerase/dehydratase family protein [Thermoflexales bacterium]|nr:NAD-dependent epimerase/dehydratase family protein [Thermoflexales bacterium]HQW36982.1 NAD-dependent epimerase/dehydratase family protein [Thermoflexales bacterium]
MRILITGATGFIGSHLAERLAADGHLVIGLDSFTDYYAPALKEGNARILAEKGINILRLDLAQDALDEAAQNADVIFHLAAQPGLSPLPFATYIRNNLIATQRLLEAARQNKNLRLFANISTSSVYGADAQGPETSEPRPTSDYGVTKLAAEQLAMAYHRTGKLPACSFRLFSVYGPRERPDKMYPKLIRALLTDSPFPLFAGSEKHLRSYTFVGDVARGLANAISQMETCAGEIFNMGNDTAITTGQAIEIVENIVGKKVKLEHLPPRPGDQSATHANIAKARRLLGFAPSTSPQEGLRKTVEWAKAEWEGELRTKK